MKGSNHDSLEVRVEASEHTEAAEARERAVRRAVETALTAKQREAVELFFFQGLSQSEIARQLGVSQQVVQKRIFGTGRRGCVVGGALARLREALAPMVLGRPRS